MFENYFKHRYIFRVDRDLLLRLHLEDDPAPSKAQLFSLCILQKDSLWRCGVCLPACLPACLRGRAGGAGPGRSPRGRRGAGGCLRLARLYLPWRGRPPLVPPLPPASPRASARPARLRSSSSGCERESPGRFSVPRPAGRQPRGGSSALARLPPGQVSAGRRAPPGSTAPGCQHRPGAAGPAGAAAAGERGRRGGRSSPNSRARLVPADGRFPFFLSSPLRRAHPPRLPEPAPAERSRGASSCQDFCLSCLCVCWFLFFVVVFFFLLVFIWLCSLAGNGRGSGAGRRNKCGEREREPELNDRMRAT
ncbi:unnamed protein product [Bubo scandiacus]